MNKLFLYLLIILSIEPLHAFNVTSFWQKLFSTNQVQSVMQENQNAVSTSIGVLKIISDLNSEVSDEALKKINQFIHDPQIKGILFVCDSSGGPCVESEIIFREFKKAAEIKPMVAFVRGVCCSGAYLLAASAHCIIAPLTATIGSIGAMQIIEKHTNAKVVSPSYSADINFEVVTAGAFKDALICQRPLTDEKRVYLQERVNEVYALFIELVSNARGLNKNEAELWADGKIFTGKTALDLNLIDQLGGYSDAVEKLKELMQAREIYSGGPLTFIE